MTRASSGEVLALECATPGLRGSEAYRQFADVSPPNRGVHVCERTPGRGDAPEVGTCQTRPLRRTEATIAIEASSCARRGQPLSDRTLHRHAVRVAVPTYDRRRLGAGVVHVGVGGFHRAHQAVYFDDLAQHGISMDWGVVGVGLRSGAMRAALAPQDWLYTVVQRGVAADEVRVVGSLRACLHARENPEAVLRVLSREETRMVTLTITGGGYHVDPVTGELAADHPDAAWRAAPATAAGYLVEALARRRRDGIAPFTVLSCDNVPGNGSVTRSAVTGLAALRDAALARWIDERVAFPDSVVDRITPATTPAVRRSLAGGHGVDDRWPVTTEAFTQWIVQDDFCNLRPPLEQVGVEFVTDVAPYALAKKRLLNGTHCAMAFLGLLAGHDTTAQVMGDPLLGEFVARLMESEILPLLAAAPGLELRGYARTVRSRLANPGMGDPLARLSARSSTKMPAYLLPSLAEARAAGRPAELLSLAVAGWLTCLAEPAGIVIEDANAARLRRLAVEGGDDPRPLLRERWLFGDLGDDETLVGSVATWMRSLRRDGAQIAIADALSSDLRLAA
jgi:mannitol 2-dehydrogenase